MIEALRSSLTSPRTTAVATIHAVAYLRDVTGTSVIVMYTSAAVLVLCALAILKVPANVVNR